MWGSCVWGERGGRWQRGGVVWYSPGVGARPAVGFGLSSARRGVLHRRPSYRAAPALKKGSVSPGWRQGAGRDARACWGGFARAWGRPPVPFNHRSQPYDVYIQKAKQLLDVYFQNSHHHPLRRVTRSTAQLPPLPPPPQPPPQPPQPPPPQPQPRRALEGVTCSLSRTSTCFVRAT